jgi:hypothetical protein
MRIEDFLSVQSRLAHPLYTLIDKGLILESEGLCKIIEREFRVQSEHFFRRGTRLLLSS